MLRRAIMAVLLLSLATSTSHAACKSPHLGGTFLQLTTRDAQRSEQQWQHLFGEFHALGLKYLFVQWTVYDHVAFFKTSRFTPVANPPLPLLLRLAKHSGIKVWLGLRYDPGLWAEIEQPPVILKVYFRKRLKETRLLVGDLRTLVGRDAAAFGGWYIPDEIDDKTWLDSDRRDILIDYLAKTVAILKKGDPHERVAISGFSDSFADPDLLARFWKNVIDKTSLNLLLFQDGVGEKKIELDNVRLYFGPLYKSVRSTGAELGDVVELFTIQPNGNREPASIDRVRRQMALTEGLTTFPDIAFSVPDYMSGLASPAAKQLLRDYLGSMEPRSCD